MKKKGTNSMPHSNIQHVDLISSSRVRIVGNFLSLKIRTFSSQSTHRSQIAIVYSDEFYSFGTKRRGRFLSISFNRSFSFMIKRSLLTFSLTSRSRGVVVGCFVEELFVAMKQLELLNIGLLLSFQGNP